MSVVRACSALAALGALAAGGCMVPQTQHAALQSQHRMLLEQNRAQLAEIENLKSHSRKLENQVIEVEQQLAQLDAQRSVDRRRLANYHQERQLLQERFVAPGQSELPAGLSARLADLARRYPMLQYDPSSGISKLDGDVLFDSASAELKPEAQNMLREFAALFQEPQARQLRMMVVGHTDNQLVAKKPAREVHPSNWHLSAARSVAVADFLRRSGMPEDRMGVAAFAQHQPLTANATAADRQRNRRVEIFVLGPETPIVGWTETTPTLY